MKAIKNKKRYDPRWHHNERQDPKTRVINEGITVSFDNFTATEAKEFPGGGPDDLPDEVPGDNEDSSLPRRTPEEEEALDARLKTPGVVTTTDHPLVEDPNEGCGEPETGLEAAEAPVMDLSPDEAYDTGYADAVEEIMNSISHLLHEPVGEPVAIEINEQPGVEDMLKKSVKDSPYADMPTIIAKLNRKSPEVKEASPIADKVKSRESENIKSAIRNWLRIGYDIDEVELTSDGQVLNVADFLEIDPMEEA
jgi:hypothetical protein